MNFPIQLLLTLNMSDKNELSKEEFEESIKTYYGASYDDKGNYQNATPDEIKARKLPPKLGEFDDNVQFFEPPTNSDGWFTIGSESYQPDKETFIVERFQKDFPHLSKIDSMEGIGALASRSPKLSQWLNKANLDYSLEAEVPLWAKDIIEPKKLKDIQINITQLNTIERKRSERLNKAASNYKAECEKINKEQDNEASKVSNQNIILAFTANSTTLPLTIQLAIENYTPADSEAPTKKTYARELLLQWRKQLLTRVIKDSNFNVKDFIDQNSLK